MFIVVRKFIFHVDGFFNQLVIMTAIIISLLMIIAEINLFCEPKFLKLVKQLAAGNRCSLLWCFIMK
jgi:hypothetical protein